MAKKPRQKFRSIELPRRRPQQPPFESKPQEEFRNCEAPEGCPNIVSMEGKSMDYSKPIRCALHRGVVEQ